MKKQIAILLMLILLLAPIIQDVSASKTVFLSSDNIMSHDEDLEMLTSIKGYIEEISNGELQVIIDNESPSAGEGYRCIAVTSDVSVSFAASDAGNYLQLANYSSQSNKQIIVVNVGDYDLDNSSNYLRRAWDDNYSTETLAGIHNPGLLLKNSGITYIQPAIEFPENTHNGVINKPNDDRMNRYIAENIVASVNGYDNESKVLSDELIVTNKIPISTMANASKEYIANNGSLNNSKYTPSQLLYLTSSYLNGNGIDVPITYGEAESPMGYSLLTRGSYSIYDYMEMAGIVRNYMDENGRAPDSIEYEGAHISYYDLLYNFAKITQNHTDSKHMGFESEYHFDKVNDSILLHIFPFILILFVLFIAYLFLKRTRRI